ncbi:MAG: M48 family metallopeptidase [Proteobacteria bacterium]|nr:M48 family metallopeptidase [Pseudomonadota bacterium]
MSGVEGQYFYPKSARFVPARAVLTGDRLIQVLGADGSLLAQAALKQVRVSERLGNIPRHIRFADGADFETADNDGLDAMLRGTGYGRSFIDRLERSWRWVAVAALTTGLASAAFLQYGIPAISYSLAQVTPPGVTHTVSQKTLQALDGTWLRPSKLTEKQKSAAIVLFGRMTNLQKKPGDYLLVFRDAPGIGPNAFALPDGTIVVTDEIWPLVKEDAEIEGVFAHEISHVNHKHGLQSIYQASLIPATIAVVTGDASQIGQIATILPGVLLQSAYSRRFEQQADDDAAATLAKAGEDPAALARFLQRMDDNFCKKRACAPSWLGSHPQTSDRVFKLLHAAKPLHALSPTKTMPALSAEQLKAQAATNETSSANTKTPIKKGQTSGGGKIKPVAKPGRTQGGGDNSNKSKPPPKPQEKPDSSGTRGSGGGARQD